MSAAALLLLLGGCVEGTVNAQIDVRSDDAVLPVQIHGRIGSGTLVLVESGGPSGPGIAERAVGYHPFQDTLEQEVAVAWYDRRGTGNASGDYRPEDQSLDQLIDDLHAVLAVLELRYAPERLVLMGHSFGSYTSALYQLEHPGVVQGWVTAAPAVMHGSDTYYISYRRDFVCRVAAEQHAEGSPDPLWDDIEGFCIANPTLPPVWDTPEREQLWSYLGQIEDLLEPWPSMNGAGLLATVFFSHYGLIDTQLRPNLISEAIVADPGQEDLLPLLSDIVVPTAVLTGEYDGTTPTELGAAVAAAVGPAAVLTEIADGGHYMMADDPEAFADAVMALIGRLESETAR